MLFHCAAFSYWGWSHILVSSVHETKKGLGEARRSFELKIERTSLKGLAKLVPHFSWGFRGEVD